MPIYDNDGTANREIGKLYDHNGSVNSQIGKAYDNNGSANSLIYSADPDPITKTLSVTTTQYGDANGTGFNYNVTKFYVPSGYTKVTISGFTPGTSFGVCKTQFYHWKNNVYTYLKNVNRAYTGAGHTWADQGTQYTTFTQADGLQELSIGLYANYNPNVSGQHASTATVTFTIT